MISREDETAGEDCMMLAQPFRQPTFTRRTVAVCGDAHWQEGCMPSADYEFGMHAKSAQRWRRCAADQCASMAVKNAQ
jgi:hypothetical protein